MPRQFGLQPVEEGRRMLDTFASVSATHFDVTFLDLEGKKCGFRPHQSLRQIKNSLPLLLPGLTERRNSLVVRPHSGTTTLIQLDDLKADNLELVRDVSFLTLQTSPGNYQAWVAVSGLSDPKDFARRLRKGAGADISASGATRVAGTVNYKRKYQPEFPTVTIEDSHPGRIVTASQLQQLGLVAPESAAPAAPFRVSESSAPLPDYAQIIKGAPLNHGQTRPDISRADFYWSLVAAKRGWAAPAIAHGLMQMSPKAKENGEEYARVTAQNAVEAALREHKRAR